MGGGDLAQAHTELAIAKDSFAIDIERLAPDVSAFELGAPHAGAHPLDDQVTFEFSNDTDDHDDGTAQRSSCVDLLAERDELDSESVQLVEHLQKVPGRAGDAIACPYQDDIETSSAGIAHQIIQEQVDAPSRR